MLRSINLKTVRFCSNKNLIAIKEILENVTKDKFSIRMVKSSGPGGQHVNKTNSKVELRFTVSDAIWLPIDIRNKLIEQQQNSINKLGELIVFSDVDRSQHRNLEDAIDKVKKKILLASCVPEAPSEETAERIISYKILENENRIQDKKLRSIKKSERKNVE